MILRKETKTNPFTNDKENNFLTPKSYRLAIKITNTEEITDFIGSASCHNNRLKICKLFILSSKTTPPMRKV